MKPLMLELFSGSATVAKAFKKAGYDVITLDIEPKFKPSMVADILKVAPSDFPQPIEVIWASVPCTHFSVCRISHHWKNGRPFSQEVRKSIRILDYTLYLIRVLKPKHFFIENPRGMMRTMPQMQRLHRSTITYCQYGANCQKPTDIWHNCLSWTPRKACRSGDSCHEPSPRNACGPIQRLHSAFERGKIPAKLAREIVKACTGQVKELQLPLVEVQA